MSTSIATTLPQGLSQQLAAGQCTLIDVREPIEHAESHIQGATLIPLGQIKARAAEIPQDRPIVLMCVSGKRSQSAAETLQQLGFTQLSNLSGGINAWKEAGLPCVLGEKRGLPIMRQVMLVAGLLVLIGSLLAYFVSPLWIFVPMFVGAGLTLSGATGFCGMAMLLAKMPWNRVGTSCCSS